MEINAIDALQFFPRVFQAGFNVARQVDLADVAGNRCLGTEADTREEHLHLFRRGVLRLI